MDKPAPTRSSLTRGVTLFLVLLCAGLAAVYMARRSAGPDSPGGPAGAIPQGPAFLNASAEVAYTGTAACARCHEKENAAYLETSHSRSLVPLDFKAEPLPATYHHEPSDLYYRMYAQGDAMRIEEMLQVESGARYVLADHPVTYRLGSGAHERAYLVDIDGFLHLAPVAWKAAEKSWTISPGYDRTLHLGFLGPADETCVACHTGRVEALDDAVNRLRLHEHAIGCERCHGPGALHDELYSRSNVAPQDGDLTIVGPALATREQELAICGQCHMENALTVPNPGKRRGDWRPGMPWNEVMLTYRPTAAWKDIELQGHVDQLRESPCFEGSDTLTCSTCHDPHQPLPEEAAARHDHYNTQCLTCHAHCGRIPDEGPGIVPPEGDDCIDCHMPQGKTRERHKAFTNHRVGIPGLVWEPPPAGERELPELEPLGDVSHLPAPARKRSMGLALLRLATRYPWRPDVAGALRKKGKDLVELALAEGLEDAEAEAALAQMLFVERSVKRAEKHAQDALALHEAGGPLSPGRLTDCLSMLAALSQRAGKVDKARAFLERAMTLRRDARDYLELLELLVRSGTPEEAAALARKAVTIWPSNSDIQYRAAEAFGRAGDQAAQERHNAIGYHMQLQQTRGQQFLDPMRK